MFLIKLGMAILARIGQDFPVMVLSFAINLGVGS
jgi:flagellar biosynthesis protein FliR